jgi:hypothetical protein
MTAFNATNIYGAYMYVSDILLGRSNSVKWKIQSWPSRNPA